MTEKWNLIIDVALCSGCQNCVLSAMDEYVGNREPGYFAPADAEGEPLLKVALIERGVAPMTDFAHLPTMCNHCDEAPCMRAARNGAVVKRADGVVLIDPEKAKGQKQIAQACPYGAAVWNEAEQVAQIWSFDAHLLDRGWKEPRGAQACATGAMRALKTSDQAMSARAAHDGLSPLWPDLKTKPRVWYRNLGRVRDRFAAGHIETEASGLWDCAEGVEVCLHQGARKISESRTDAFGDFKLDGLNPQGAPAWLVIAGRRFDIDPKINTYLGNLVLADGAVHFRP
jgi:Fe-S-cluster-containing dehydrogenase component